MEHNIKLDTMVETANDYGRRSYERRKVREKLMDADKWDELKESDARWDAENPDPYTSGQNKALSQYVRSLRNGADVFEVENLPWDYELADFVETLRKAGITAIVVTDQSTGLMDGIYGLTSLGCRMNGLKTVTRADDHRFGSKEPERKNGIEFLISEEA
jgi:hypothetical protein